MLETSLKTSLKMSPLRKYRVRRPLEAGIERAPARRNGFNRKDALTAIEPREIRSDWREIWDCS